MYNLYIDNDLVASGLSQGELAQWLIDLSNEVEGFARNQFKKDLGWISGDFEDFLYDNELYEVTAMLGKEKIYIAEDEF